MEIDGVTGVEIHYILSGFVVLIGSVAFMKVFDFLAAQSAKRLLAAANEDSAE